MATKNFKIQQKHVSYRAIDLFNLLKININKFPTRFFLSLFLRFCTLGMLQTDVPSAITRTISLHGLMNILKIRYMYILFFSLNYKLYIKQSDIL